MYLYPGSWKNFDDVESNLTREELSILLEKGRDYKEDNMRFMAALQGVDIGNSKASSFEDVKRRAQARLNEMSEEQYELSGLFSFEEEDGE